MFQYAAGLALAERLGAELLVDIRHYARKDRGDRRLGLLDFGIELQTTRVPPFRIIRRLAIALRLLPDPFRGAESLVSNEGFNPRFLELTAPAALSGFLQSWRYFEGHEASVRRVFDVRRLATPRTATLAAEIAAVRNPVAVHIRRGDYTRSPETVAFFGLLHADHYFRARSALEAQVEEPTYFLFSDDADIALAELAGWQGLRPVTGFSAYEDMFLMSSWGGVARGRAGQAGHRPEAMVWPDLPLPGGPDGSLAAGLAHGLKRQPSETVAGDKP